MSGKTTRIRLTDDDGLVWPREWDVALRPDEESRLRWAVEQPAEILLGTLVELDMPRGDSAFNEMYDAAERCGVPVMEVLGGCGSRPEMPDAEFRKWFDVLWSRFWSKTREDETIGQMWESLISQGFPKDEFYDECRRRNIIIGDANA